jgi:hypothetical protein
MVAATAVTLLALASPASAASVSPTSKNYGDQAVGTTSTPTSFTLTTTANTCALDPSNVIPTCLIGSQTHYATNTSQLGGGPGVTTTSGDFMIHNVSCPYPSFDSPAITTAPVGLPGMCGFEVSFAPVGGNARSKTLIFSDNGGPSATLPLTGTGLVPATALPLPGPSQARKKCKKKHHRAVAAKKKCKKKR